MSADRDELDRNVGLEARYHVTKIDDPAGKHDECRYFVLDPQHDLIARGSLAHYATEARMLGHEALADDLERWIEGINTDEKLAELDEDEF